MDNIIVIGSSGHAKVVIDIIEKQALFHIAGLIDRFKSKGEMSFQYPILGAEEDIPEILKTLNVIGGVIAIGDNWVRSKVASTIKELIPDFRFISAIHPSSQIARGVKIGAGTVVMAGTVINSDSIIGEHCIVNTKSSIGHDNVIGDFVTIAPNATTGGNVKIQNYSVLSLGASVIHHINIGEHTVIGAGSTVIYDVPSFVVAFGTPAKVQRERVIGEKYL